MNRPAILPHTCTSDPAAPAGNTSNTSNHQILQDPFALVNLMARHEIDKNRSAQLSVDNLTDQIYGARHRAGAEPSSLAPCCHAIAMPAMATGGRKRRAGPQAVCSSSMA